ncbi:MAG: methyltransferase domain-containing protein [Deltaproteobacteria bacterium]|nr:methyltransferase domain-containing protein [Deltaproteobacteria bacterium]
MSYAEGHEPAALLREYLHLFTNESLPGPVLDLACGDCRNGLLLAKNNLSVVCCDIAQPALDAAREEARRCGVGLECVRADLEENGINLLREDYYGGIMVFRYLHRPLIPFMKKAVREGGILMYETYTVDQSQFGKPHNPDYLLTPGELRGWFSDWDIIHYYEGIKDNPKRAVSQIICRKGAQ